MHSESGLTSNFHRLTSMSNLFSNNRMMDEEARPLADRLRPKTLSEVVGQDHLLGDDGSIQLMLNAQKLPSIIFWGPSGVGKTTIARLLATKIGFEFESVSAVFSGVKELREVFDKSRQSWETGKGTLLFVDEIHRFNRAQQDGFLPYVENGTITLIGATTENPSFEINSALLSRCSVLTLRTLDFEALNTLLARAEDFLGKRLPIDDLGRNSLIGMADGDGRYLLNMVQQIYYSFSSDTKLDQNQLVSFLQKRAPVYDKDRDGHYNLISALHKSVRGSDPDASLYWFARMLDGGEDPLYLGRRMIRMASEDIGLADNAALMITNEAVKTYERLGSPEGELALAHALVYLATAPKSNAVYVAYKAARKSAKDTGSLDPPKHILNAPTRLMKDEGYGKGYAYDHDEEEQFSGQNYFPDGMQRQTFYEPKGVGREEMILKRLKHWAKLRTDKESQ